MPLKLIGKNDSDSSSNFNVLQTLRCESLSTIGPSFVLTGEAILTISGSRDWHQRLISAAANPARSLIFDMSSVEKIDTACLQLLTAFVFKARADNIALTWHEPSEHFLAAVNGLNLNTALGM